MRLKVAAILALAAGFWLPHVQAGVNVGATRVIYQSKEKEANLSLSNSSEDGVPYLVQSWVSPYENRDDSADEFIITPPLFRLDAKPGSLTKRMLPFIKCMRRLQMDKPRPVPATTFLAESA